MWTVVRQVCFQEKQRRHCLDHYLKKKFFFFFFYQKGTKKKKKILNLFNWVKQLLGPWLACQSTGDSTGGRAHGSTAVAIRGLVYEWLDPRHALELQETRQVLEGAPQP